jgi:hypothetical protein
MPPPATSTRGAYTSCAPSASAAVSVPLAIREEALQEWTRADSFHDICVCWGRLGGRVTLHRYGRQHFAQIARSYNRAHRREENCIEEPQVA